MLEHWTVHPQVGVSGYRIDIGVVDPRAPGRYLLGVECDGRTYHSGATARDRDRLRQHVLEGLGWQLHRIWSTDWWLNPQEPIRKLIAKLELLVAEDVSHVDEEPVVELENHGATSDQPEESAATSFATLAEPESIVTSSPLVEYRALEPAGGKPEAFYEFSSKAEIRKQLLDVLNAEGPIADAALFRRIARAWGLSRTGRRIEELLRGLIPGHLNNTRAGDICFYWPEGVHPAQWDGFRVAGSDAASRRSIEEISLEELGNLAVFILTEHGGTSFEDLARSICRLQGVARTTSDAETRIRQSLSSGRAGKLIEVTNGVVSLSRSQS